MQSGMWHDLRNGIIRRNVKTFGCRGQCNFILRLRDFETLLNFAETYEFSMEHSTPLTVGTNRSK